MEKIPDEADSNHGEHCCDEGDEFREQYKGRPAIRMVLSQSVIKAHT